MDTCCNIYMLAICNKEPVLATTAIQSLQDKKKLARSSSIMIALAQRHPSGLTSFEEHHAFFDQVLTLLEPAIQHNEVFYNNPPDKIINFGQDLK